MATTLPQPPVKDRRPSRGGHSGDGGYPGFTPPYRNQLALDDSSPASRTGIWVGLAGITMMFAAFTSALVVRQGSAADWRHVDLPSVLYLNTPILLASSVALELARRHAAAFGRGSAPERSATQLWLWITLGLGMAFVGGQYAAWLKLKAEGLYLATNPSSSFFYVLTATHALHVLGGLGGLLLCVVRLSRTVPTLRRSTLNTVTYYWHFMDILWIYLLALLWFEL